MKTNQTMMAGIAILVLSLGAAQAGPCTTGKDGKMGDAGAGPTPGNTGQTITTGSANTAQHPPTSAMGNATAGGATSSEDVRRKTQGQPTAAQQAQGAASTARPGDC
jgi:hypothetical protein